MKITFFFPQVRRKCSLTPIQTSHLEPHTMTASMYSLMPGLPIQFHPHIYIFTLWHHSYSIWRWRYKNRGEEKKWLVFPHEEPHLSCPSPHQHSGEVCLYGSACLGTITYQGDMRLYSNLPAGEDWNAVHMAVKGLKTCNIKFAFYIDDKTWTTTI